MQKAEKMVEFYLRGHGEGAISGASERLCLNVKYIDSEGALTVAGRKFQFA